MAEQEERKAFTYKKGNEVKRKIRIVKAKTEERGHLPCLWDI